MVERDHAVRIVESTFKVNEFGNMETVTVYFSSSTSTVRMLLPKSCYKSGLISASNNANASKFKDNKFWHMKLKIFVSALTRCYFISIFVLVKSKLVSFSYFTAVFTNDKLIASTKFTTYTTKK